MTVTNIIRDFTLEEGLHCANRQHALTVLSRTLINHNRLQQLDRQNLMLVCVYESIIWSDTLGILV